MKKVVQGHLELIAKYNLDDYPPGTPLPEVPAPEVSGGNPVLRAWVRRRATRERDRQQARLEALRDEYFRTKQQPPPEGARGT